MRTRFALLAAGLLLTPGLFAQKLDIQLDRLVPLAKEHVVVDLTADQIKALLATKLADSPKAKSLEARLAGLESVHVRVFEFAGPNKYSQADLDSIRQQVRAPGWSKVVSVKDEGETVEVHMMARDGKSAGFAVVVAEPDELTVVNIVGTLTLDDLKAFSNSGISIDLLAMSTKAAVSK